jgi:hypothetical protein
MTHFPSEDCCARGAHQSALASTAESLSPPSDCPPEPPEPPSASTTDASSPASGCPASGSGMQAFIVQVLPGGHGTLPEHCRHVFETQAGPPGLAAQSALTPHSWHVFTPLVTQIGVGSAHCELSRHASQLLLIQAGRPAAVQSVSAPHSSQSSPTQTGPPALVAQCELF